MQTTGILTVLAGVDFTYFRGAGVGLRDPVLKNCVLSSCVPAVVVYVNMLGKYMNIQYLGPYMGHHGIV